MFGNVTLLLSVYGGVLLLTETMRRYAVRRRVMDIPSGRSSHLEPTPRGGGMAFVIVILAALPLIAWRQGGAWADLAPVAVAAGGAAALGWADDHRNLPVGARLAVQLGLAVVLVALIGPLPGVEIGGLDVRLGWLGGAIIAVAWIVWLTNLYNFMDGIDGIAAVQATIAGATLSIWFVLAGAPALALAAAVLAAGALGFLAWNWPPARIFMGDSGSLALGMVFAVFSLLGMVHYGLPWGGFAVLLGVFLADATVTLMARILRGEKFWRPHRSHFYQRAVGAGWSHGRVTGTVLVLDLALACLATLETLAVSPRGLWVALAALLLLLAGGAVVWGERRRV